MTEEPLVKFRLMVVTARGYGLDRMWGDSYEVTEPDYPAARANVLGRVGTDDKPAYERVTKAWRFNEANKTWEEIGGIL